MVNNSRVTLLFTSDEHGFVSAQSKLQGQVKKARAENPQGTLLVSSGDVFEGSAENGVLGIESSRAMMEAAGYDVMTVGNHDFDHGADAAREWVKGAKASVLVSNVRDTKTGGLLENTAPSKVFELNGVKVGLIGVTTPETAAILPPAKLQGLKFEDPTVAVKAEVAKLQAAGIEVIGLVSHLGLPVDREMAKSVPELDFILGGHTHDALMQPEKVGQTLIAHPGSFRKYMGRLDLDINPTTGQVESSDYHLLPGAEEMNDDGKVGELANEYSSKVDAAMGKPIADLPMSFSYDPNQLGDGMEGLVCDAAASKSPADFVMINQKGIRSGLKKGVVTLRDAFNAFPFDNRLVSVSMPSSEVAKIYEESFRRLDQTSLTVGGRMGLSCDVNTGRVNLLEKIPLDFMGPYNAIAPVAEGDDGVMTMVADNHRVDVVTVDYLLQGGLNYFAAGATPVQEDLGVIRDILRDHLSNTYPLPANEA